MIGLGRMGANMVRRLMQGGHTCVVYDRSADAVAALVKEGATGSSSLAEFVKKLEKPRAPLPDGARRLRGRHRSTSSRRCSRRATPIIDGGNSHYQDDIARAKRLAAEGPPLRRHGHERRRLGPRARLLPDDRRRGRGGEAPRPDLRDARAGPRRHPAHAGPREARAAPPSTATCTAARTAPATS